MIKTIKRRERRHLSPSGVFVVNFQHTHASHFFPKFLLLTLSKKMLLDFQAFSPILAQCFIAVSRNTKFPFPCQKTCGSIVANYFRIFNKLSHTNH